MTTSTIQVEQTTGTVGAPRDTYNYALGYLRAMIVVLVVAHHAVLAYHPFAPPAPASLAAQPRWWQAFPVVDPQRGGWVSLLAAFNDTFFMALMFLLSGLFVWNGLQKKGGASFLRGRLARLGLPFVVAAAVVAPLAYYPTYLQMPGHAAFGGFVRQWFSLGTWPAGPAWFIWVLLVFDACAALLFAAAPKWAERLGGFLAGPVARPARFFAILATVSALVYLPLELVYSGLYWSAFGPFTFQTSRILHYLAYFLAGAGLGAWGLNRGPLSPQSKLASRWWLWAISAVVVFVIYMATAVAFLTSHAQSRGWEVAIDFMFAGTCATISLAFLAMFLRFARRRWSVLDSLNRNSYGIYLVHYAFVSWLQLSMVGATMPASAKFAVVFIGSVAASWITVIGLRRIPGVARVI